MIYLNLHINCLTLTYSSCFTQSFTGKLSSFIKFFMVFICDAKCWMFFFSDMGVSKCWVSSINLVGLGVNSRGVFSINLIVDRVFSYSDWCLLLEISYIIKWGHMRIEIVDFDFYSYILFPIVYFSCIILSSFLFTISFFDQKDLLFS